MNCFDCAALGDATPAVATCADCGAAVCPAHARVAARWLTRAVPVNRVVAAEVPARTIRRGICQVAAGAAPEPRRYEVAYWAGTRPLSSRSRARVLTTRAPAASVAFHGTPEK